jgi:hypothetical protein
MPPSREVVPILCKGPLWTERKGKSISRYFVLLSDRLEYYEDIACREDGASPCGSVLVADIDRFQRLRDGFSLHLAKLSASLELHVPEKGDLEAWVDAWASLLAKRLGDDFYAGVPRPQKCSSPINQDAAEPEPEEDVRSLSPKERSLCSARFSVSSERGPQTVALVTLYRNRLEHRADDDGANLVTIPRESVKDIEVFDDSGFEINLADGRRLFLERTAETNLQDWLEAFRTVFNEGSPGVAGEQARDQDSQQPARKVLQEGPLMLVRHGARHVQIFQDRLELFASAEEALDPHARCCDRVWATEIRVVKAQPGGFVVRLDEGCLDLRVTASEDTEDWIQALLLVLEPHGVPVSRGLTRIREEEDEEDEEESVVDSVVQKGRLYHCGSQESTVCSGSEPDEERGSIGSSTPNSHSRRGSGCELTGANPSRASGPSGSRGSATGSRAANSARGVSPQLRRRDTPVPVAATGGRQAARGATGPRPVSPARVVSPSRISDSTRRKRSTERPTAWERPRSTERVGLSASRGVAASLEQGSRARSPEAKLGHQTSQRQQQHSQVLELSSPLATEWLASLKETPLHHGFLDFLQKGQTMKRYCLLFRDHLDSWDSPASAVQGIQPLGRVDLHDFRSLEITKDGFLINCGGGRRTPVRVSDSDALQAWYDAMFAILVPATPGSERAASSSSASYERPSIPRLQLPTHGPSGGGGFSTGGLAPTPAIHPGMRCRSPMPARGGLRQRSPGPPRLAAARAPEQRGYCPPARRP